MYTIIRRISDFLLSETKNESIINEKLIPSWENILCISIWGACTVIHITYIWWSGEQFRIYFLFCLSLIVHRNNIVCIIFHDYFEYYIFLLRFLLFIFSDILLGTPFFYRTRTVTKLTFKTWFSQYSTLVWFMDQFYEMWKLISRLNFMLYGWTFWKNFIEYKP